MAKLILNPTSSSRREIRLQRSLVSIGRDPSNDLVLPDAMVSRRHAVIEYRGNQYFLRDCNSSNGSVVNGDRVSERSLRDGDLVAIGTARLLFREEAQTDEPGAKVVPHPSVPRLQCPSCQAEYRRGDLFCRECGTQLAVPSGPPKAVCASCGTAVALPARFCNACGAALPAEGERLEVTKPQPTPEGRGPGDAAPPEKAAGIPVGAVDSAVPRADRAEAASAPAEEKPSSETLPPPEPPPRDVAASLPEPPGRSSSGSGAEVVRVAKGPVSAAAVAPAATPARPLARASGVEKHWSSPERHRAPAKPAASRPAGLGPRLVAGLLDAALVAVAQAMLTAPILYYWWARELPRTPSDVPFLPILLSVGLLALAAALGVAYYVYFWGIQGATPGKELLGLAVQAEDGTSPIGVRQALLRVFGYMLSAATLGIGFLMIAFGGRGLHDRIAGTRVVRGQGD